MREVGDVQNMLLSRTMDIITQRTVEEIGNVNTQLDATLKKFTEAINSLWERRGGVRGAAPGDSRLPVGTEPVRAYAAGGFVKGRSHGAGGVLAELEGGEYVLPKGHGIGTSTSPSNLITAGADVSGTIGGASATGVGIVWKRAKGYAKGGVAY